RRLKLRCNQIAPPFTFKISFTSLRYRDPRTRRAALTLLYQAPRVQGLHPCSFPAAMSEKIWSWKSHRPCQWPQLTKFSILVHWDRHTKLFPTLNLPQPYIQPLTAWTKNTKNTPYSKRDAHWVR
ncbi:DNA repair protein rad10, partial [Penicillium sp. IBT 31633x]